MAVYTMPKIGDGLNPEAAQGGSEGVKAIIKDLVMTACLRHDYLRIQVDGRHSNLINAIINALFNSPHKSLERCQAATPSINLRIIAPHYKNLRSRDSAISCLPVSPWVYMNPNSHVGDMARYVFRKLAA
jgi:hypothetical protein